MLKALATETPAEFVDWFQIDRIEGREVDVGLHRHWIDPTVPFAMTVARPAHGVLVTSATLTDSRADIASDADAAWRAAEARTGAVHLPETVRASVPSPFDYAAQTRVLVVTDVKRDDVAQVASAYRELFLAAGGGALGLFTAIHRLRAVHARIARPLEAAGLPLYGQHVDGLETGMLVDIFRGEEDSCLLGTDAIRDGVDVPGRSLRLIVFDRVPWPRPDILHKARKATFGGAAYDDMIVRLRLKQAYGRLVRRADDTGVFVLLDSRLPSRLATAFPDGVAPRRVGLAEAIAITRDFLAAGPSPPPSPARSAGESEGGRDSA
jgi:ATP-dependent DNA helicase DinG